jgi:hypothetical protein
MGKMSKMDLAMKAIELGKSAHGLAGTAQDLRNADKGELGRQAGRHVYDQGTDAGKEVGKTWLKTFEVIPRLVCRALQFLFAIIACGFYGNRVDADRKADDGFSPEWIFAILVAGLSAVTAVLFVIAAPISAIPFIGSRIKITKTYRAFPWDATLFIAWIVVFGIFAGIFLNRDSDEPSYKGSSTTAMKTAVWIDFVNALLWLVSGVYGAVKTFLGEKVDSLTDKAGSKLFSKKQPANKEMENYAESV